MHVPPCLAEGSAFGLQHLGHCLGNFWGKWQKGGDSPSWPEAQDGGWEAPVPHFLFWMKGLPGDWCATFQMISLMSEATLPTSSGHKWETKAGDTDTLSCHFRRRSGAWEPLLG